MRSSRWFHRIRLDQDTLTPGEYPHTAAEATARFGLPESLEGQTVLDIGAWDGLFSFEAERRGAQVTATHTTPERGGNWGGTVGFNFGRRACAQRSNSFPPACTTSTRTGTGGSTAAAVADGNGGTVYAAGAIRQR